MSLPNTPRKVSVEFRPTYNVELNHKEIRTGEHRGKHQVLIRVTVNKKHTRHSTGVYIEKKNWNPKAKFGKWVRNASQPNVIIEDKINELKRLTEGIKADAKDFFIYAYDFIKQYNNERKQATYDLYVNKLMKLAQFAGNHLPFQAITVEFLRKYANWLRIEKKNRTNTIAQDMSKIRAILNQALKEDLITKSPFGAYSIETERTFKSRLTKDELERIIKLPLEPGSQIFIARDAFLLSLYLMGQRVGDIVTLKIHQREGNIVTFFTGKSLKTKRIPMVPQAVEIWDRNCHRYFIKRPLFF